MNRLSKVLVICGALLIWYAIIGFLIAPTLIRHFDERELQANFYDENLQAQWAALNLGGVQLNP